MSEVSAKKGRRHEETIVRKVSRRGEHDAHGGTWKVAFADFCLALLCLFMVLWVLSARDAEESARVVSLSAIYKGGAGLLDADRMKPDERSLVDPLIAMPAAWDGGKDDQAPTSYASDDELKSLAQAIEAAAHDARLENNLQAVITPFLNLAVPFPISSLRN